MEVNHKIDVDAEAHYLAKKLAETRGITVKAFVSSLIRREARGKLPVEKKHLQRFDYNKAELDAYNRPPFWQGRKR